MPQILYSTNYAENFGLHISLGATNLVLPSNQSDVLSESSVVSGVLLCLPIQQRQFPRQRQFDHQRHVLCVTPPTHIWSTFLQYFGIQFSLVPIPTWPITWQHSLRHTGIVDYSSKLMLNSFEVHSP